MMKCKCGGYYAELGELEPSEPCVCKENKIKDLETQLAKREDDYRKLRKRSDEQIEKLQKQLADSKAEVENLNYLLVELSSLVRVDIQNHEYKKELIRQINELSIKRVKKLTEAKR